MRLNFVKRASMLGLIILAMLFLCRPAVAQYGRDYDQYSKGGTTTQADDTYGKGGTKEETSFTAKTGTTVPKEDLTFKQTIWKDKDGRVRHASDGRVDIVFAYDNCGRRTSVTVFETAGGKRTQIQRVEKKYDKSCDDQDGHLVDNEKPDEVDFENLYDLLDNFGLDWFPRWVNLNAGAPPKKDETATPPNNENRSVPPPENAKVETGNGLIKVIFNVPGGNVIVNLPDDASGTISGTVIEEPKHKSPSEDDAFFTRQMYLDLLKREPGPGESQFWKSTVGEKGSAPAPVKFTIDIPPNQPIPIILRDKDGNPLGSITLPPTFVSPLSPETAPSSFQIPPVGQQGRLIEIIGPFDGNSSNTKVEFLASRPNVTPLGGDWNGMVPLAESPRKVIVQSPSDVSGQMEIRVKEGVTETKGTFRNVGVNLTAPKTSLLKGERTTLTVQVNGLQGISKPVPLTLDSQGVITMEGGMYQQLTIQPSQVGADGRYTMTRGITGVQAGGWTATVTVVTQPFNVCLQDDNNPKNAILFNSFTGDYVFFCPGCSSAVGSVIGGVGQLSVGARDWVNRYHDIWYGFGFSNAPPGRGQISTTGCTVSLQDKSADRSVAASVNMCADPGARDTMFVSDIFISNASGEKKIAFRITDRNMRDNTCPVH